MRRNGFEAAKNPILRTLDTIQNRDAELVTDGKRADWPRADVIVGNPPVLGNKKMILELGERPSGIERGPRTGPLILSHPTDGVALMLRPSFLGGS